MTSTAEQEVDGLEAHAPEPRTSARQLAPAGVHLEMAEWLLAREMTEPGGMLGVPEAAERAYQKFLDRLAKLITPMGCEALLVRALYLARSDFEFLHGIEPAVLAVTYIGGLRHCAEDAAPDQVERGLAALLGLLLELTVLFIGEQLTVRLALEI